MKGKVSLALCSLLMAIALYVRCTNPGQCAENPRDAGQPHASLAIHHFSTTYTANARIPLLVAFGYMGKTPLYLLNPERNQSLPFAVYLRDAQGNEVPMKPRKLFTPALYSHQPINGKMMAVHPVTKIAPQSASSTILPDALRYYQPLPPGKYSVTVELARSTCTERQVIVEKETKRLWVDAHEKNFGHLQLDSNTISIIIAAPKKHR